MVAKKIIGLTVLVATLVACEEKETGACEASYENWQGYTLYTCKENEESDMCEGSKEHFWVDKSCANLGYTYFNSKNGNFQIDENNNGIPGPYGEWGDGTASGGSGGSGSGGGSCDASGYNGPEFDIQVDSQCKTAYYYDCIGNQQGVNAACAVYKQWQDDDSSIPDCPYCN